MTTSKFLPELEAFQWAGRDVFVIYDSDISQKARVKEAEQKLCSILSERGAETYKVRLPDDNDKVGLDDYLLDHSDDDLFDLLQSTNAASPSYVLPKTLKELMDTDYPPTQWIWEKFILKGEVNLLYANGGVGKSMLALNLAIHCASGLPFLEDTTTSTPVLILFAEDGEAEVNRRAKAIYASIKPVKKPPRKSPDLFGNTSLSDIPALKKNPSIKLWCNPLEGATLATISDTGEITEEPRLHNLRAELKKIGKPAFIILDSLIDLFNMNEILRPPVNSALKKVLGGVNCHAKVPHLGGNLHLKLPHLIC